MNKKERDKYKIYVYDPQDNTIKPHNSNPDRIAELEAENAALKVERDALKDWKESALEVERSWDVQKLAKEMGLGLGEPIRAQIAPYIKSLKAELNHAVSINNPCHHTGLESFICEVCGYPDPRKMITALKAERDNTCKRAEELGESQKRTCTVLDGLDTKVSALAVELGKIDCSLGVGSGDGKLFVYGDYESIKATQAIILERDRLKVALKDFSDFILEECDDWYLAHDAARGVKKAL